ncbi:MAG: FecR domain-containing protein, partial [Odoribacter sp.]
MVWKIFEKARRLSQQLALVVMGDEKPGTELEEWGADNEIMVQFLDPEALALLLQEFEQKDKGRAVWALRRQIRERKRRRFLLRCSKVAAIIFLGLGCAIFTYHYYASNPQEKLQAGNITVGGQQAVLILANGESMDLAQVSRMNETDGTTIIKTNLGELTYMADSTTSSQTQYNTIVVPRYGEYAVVLADGTRVKLNSESELRYPTVFNGERREVFLKGEAYLEVSKSQQPFIVYVYDAQVQVYGTCFDINSYNPGQIQVVLVEGKVGVRNALLDEVVLYPDQLAKISDREGITVREDINVDYYIAWQNGYFAFEEERLEDIMTTLSR